MFRVAALVLLGSVSLCGCTDRPKSVPLPSYAPAATAQRAFAEYDKNKDGALDADELAGCPALKSFAKNELKGAKLDVDALQARLIRFQDANVGILAVGLKVLRHGSPLVGARVTFVPENFHGGAIKPATGITDDHGSAQLKQEGAEFSGVAPGFYRIQVSLKDAAGQETLPARFNSQTVLGEEVSPWNRGVVVNLDE